MRSGALVSHPEERGQNTGKPFKKQYKIHPKNLHKNNLYVKKDVLKWRYIVPANYLVKYLKILF